MSQSYGYLIVTVTTALQTIPLPDVEVSVFSDEDGVSKTVRRLVTGVDGRTEKIELSSPPRENSLTPTPSGLSYSLYGVTAALPGYYPMTALDVAVFSGITTVQPINLLPITAGNDVDAPEFTPLDPPSESYMNPELQPNEGGQNNNEL